MYVLIGIIILLISLLASEYYQCSRTLYFAYGANTNQAYFKNRVPRAKYRGPAYLENHAFKWYGHADVVAEEGSLVVGVLWEIPNTDFFMLDLYETNYTRETVTVVGKRSLKAEIYTMKIKEDTKPTEEYTTLVYAGYVENGLDTRQLN